MKVGEYKSPGGLIRVKLDREGGKISDIEFTGDFFLNPEEKLQDLEEKLEDKRIDKDVLLKEIQNFYGANEIEVLCLEPEDWWKAIAITLEDKK